MNRDQAIRRVQHLMRLQKKASQAVEPEISPELSKTKKRLALQRYRENPNAKVFGLKAMSKCNDGSSSDPILFGAYSKNKQHFCVLTIVESIKAGFTPQDCIYGGR